MPTQIEIRDLKNTQWLFDNVVNSLGNAQFAFKLDFTSNGDTFDTIVLNIVGGEIKLYYIHNYTGPDYVYSTSTGWVNDNYKQIEITGGEHATAIGSTIAWLKQNANLIDMQINAPVIVLENNVISWNAILEATYYEVYKNGTLFATLTTTSINVFANSGTFYVVAKNENFASANSNEVVYTEKNILMHPQTNGELDKETNLYPKTLYENIVDMINHITNEVIAGSDKLVTSGAVREALGSASNFNLVRCICDRQIGTPTTYSVIHSLIYNLKVPYIVYGHLPEVDVYIATDIDETNDIITFTAIKGTTLRTITVNDQNEWSYERSISIERTSNKSTNLNNPDNVHYPTTKAVSDGLALKVDTEAGKGLSENDFTDAYKNKVDSAIQGVKVNDTALTPTDNVVNVTVPTKTSDLTNDGDGGDTDADKFATKGFVNSSISTNTANFLGTYNIVTDLGLTTSATHEAIATAIATKLASLSTPVTNNDYVFVAYPDATVPTEYTQFDRYKYNSSTSLWGYEYTLNNSSFTAAQWAAISSGITSVKVTNYDNHIADNTIHVTQNEKTTWNGKSVVSVSDTGTSTDEVNYITINGVEKKIGGGSAITPNPESAATEELKKATIGSTVYQVQNIELSDTSYVVNITFTYSDNSTEVVEGIYVIDTVNQEIHLEV